MGNVTAYKQRVNFELALKLEVDPAARRPGVTARLSHSDAAGPVLRLRLTESVPVPGPGQGVTAAEAADTQRPEQPAVARPGGIMMGHRES